MNENTQIESAESYEAPMITDHGDLTELTAHYSNYAVLDASFGAGTPVADITSSNP